MSIRSDNVLAIVDYVLARDPEADKVSLVFDLVDFSLIHDEHLAGMRGMIDYAIEHGNDVTLDIRHDLAGMHSRCFSPRSSSYADYQPLAE